LKIDINALISGQKWRGLTKLSLENGSESPLTEGFAWMLHRLAWEGESTGMKLRIQAGFVSSSMANSKGFL
jgi:hypothetical protein